MKKQPRLPALLLSLLLLAGCASAPSPSPEQTAGTGGTRTITDAAGRQVEIPETVSSVVCVGVCTLRYTTYLQAQDLVVGEGTQWLTATASHWSFVSRSRNRIVPSRIARMGFI